MVVSSSIGFDCVGSASVTSTFRPASFEAAHYRHIVSSVQVLIAIDTGSMLRAYECIEQTRSALVGATYPRPYGQTRSTGHGPVGCFRNSVSTDRYEQGRIYRLRRGKVGGRTGAFRASRS